MNKLTHRLLATLLVFVLVTLSGCNTVKGLGEDIESLGESMQDAGK